MQEAGAEERTRKLCRVDADFIKRQRDFYYDNQSEIGNGVSSRGRARPNNENSVTAGVGFVSLTRSLLSSLPRAERGREHSRSSPAERGITLRPRERYLATVLPPRIRAKPRLPCGRPTSTPPSGDLSFWTSFKFLR